MVPLGSVRLPSAAKTIAPGGLQPEGKSAGPALGCRPQGDLSTNHGVVFNIVKEEPHYSKNPVVMVDEVMSSSPPKFSFPEAGLRIMITNKFGPRTRLRMASRIIINEVSLRQGPRLCSCALRTLAGIGPPGHPRPGWPLLLSLLKEGDPNVTRGQHIVLSGGALLGRQQSNTVSKMCH